MVNWCVLPFPTLIIRAADAGLLQNDIRFCRLADNTTLDSFKCLDLTIVLKNCSFPTYFTKHVNMCWPCVEHVAIVLSMLSPCIDHVVHMLTVSMR